MTYTAVMVLLVYFSNGQLKTSVTPMQDMNVCHDVRVEAANRFRMFNEERQKADRIRQWTALCLDLSEWAKDTTSAKGKPL